MFLIIVGYLVMVMACKDNRYILFLYKKVGINYMCN